MAVTLLDLPATIMEDIAKLLCPHCHPRPKENIESYSICCSLRCWVPATLADRKGLASLCRANKALHALATRYLYHQPHPCVLGNAKTMSRLYRTITSRRPELAKCIKSVNVEMPGNATQTFGTQDGSRFLHAILPALFAALCPGLEELCVRHTTDTELMAETLPSLRFPPAGSLPRLRALHVRSYGTGFMGIKDLVPLLSTAPGLTRLSIDTLVENEASEHADLPVMADLRELALFYCELNVPLLDFVLRRCPALERLTVHDLVCNREEAHPSDVWRTTPQALADTIVGAAPGLQFLRLRLKRDAWPGAHWSDRSFSRHERFRSLKGLHHLEELRLDYGSMWAPSTIYWPEEEDGHEGEHEDGESQDGQGFEDLNPDADCDDSGEGEDEGEAEEYEDALGQFTNLLPRPIRLVHWEGKSLPIPVALKMLTERCGDEYPSLKVLHLHRKKCELEAVPTYKLHEYLRDVKDALAGVDIELRLKDWSWKWGRPQPEA